MKEMEETRSMHENSAKLNTHQQKQQDKQFKSKIDETITPPVR